MKLLYIASNPDQSTSLLLEREITELQRRLSRVATHQSIEMKFLLDLPVEEIPTEISSFGPTILHISAHGEEEELTLANADKAPVKIQAKTLAALLAVPNPPKVVYLNACNSLNLATEISNKVSFVIGTTSPITNRAARSSAVRFYELLLGGYHIGEAIQNSAALVEALSEGKTTTKLVHSVGIEPTKFRIVEPLEIVARFGDEEGPDFVPEGDGMFNIQYGVQGCPPTTTVIEFFTDDSDADDSTLDSARERPIRGRYWMDSDTAYGDFRICVAGMTGDGRVFAVSSLLSVALRAYFSAGGYGDLSRKKMQQFEEAIAALVHSDGG